jgi:membrane protease YdiL (CAAX protease family)
VWYLVAGFALPAAIVSAAVAVRGPAAWEAVVSDPGLVTGYLAGLALVPLINLWEETGWMGFVQARLEQAHGPLRAAVATGLLFGTLHLPLFFPTTTRDFLVTALVTVVVAVPFRVVLGWLYHRAGESVLVVAIAHAAFNAANDGPLTLAVWPDAWPTTVAPAVLAVAAVLILATSRGRR